MPSTGSMELTAKGTLELVSMELPIKFTVSSSSEQPKQHLVAVNDRMKHLSTQPFDKRDRQNDSPERSRRAKRMPRSPPRAGLVLRSAWAKEDEARRSRRRTKEAPRAESRKHGAERARGTFAPIPWRLTPCAGIERYRNEPVRRGRSCSEDARPGPPQRLRSPYDLGFLIASGMRRPPRRRDVAAAGT